MPDDPASATPTNYQRTTGGHLRWQPPTPEQLQEMLPAYEILSILGQGGMGAVYKGRQKSLDRTVAIKILPPEAAEDDMQFVERFKNEARTMAKMNHASIVHVYDFGETSDGQLYIVMEFIDGTDVAKMIQSQGKLPEDYALSITAHVCDALGYAHKNGIVHRDIKPANVLINMEGQVKVADFGLAKATDAGQLGLTKTNMAMGTPDFVSPEALMPGVPLDGRADLYAVGVMLYNMLTGTIPRGAFRMPSATLQTDARFDKIIGKAMEMDRELRYQTALDLRRDLDVILTTPAAKTGMQTIPAQQVAAQQSLPQKPMGKTPQQRSADAPIRREPAAKSAPPPVQKSNTGMIYGIIAAVVVIALAAFMLTGGGKKPAVAAVTATTEEPPKPIPPPSPSNTKASATPGEVLTFGGHRYQVLLEPLAWPAAKAKAESMGGHLATITSKEEADFVTKTIGPGLIGLSDIPSRHGIILGASWSAASNSWQCDTGEAFDLEALAAKRFIPKRADARLIWSYRGERWDFVGNSIPLFSLVEWDDDGSKPALAMPAAARPAQVATPAAPAAVSVMPPPAPVMRAVASAPAPPADPRLAQLAAGFKARYEADAEKPYLAAVTALNQSYVANGIGRARAAAQQKGALEEVTSLDTEKRRIENNEPLPPADLDSLPVSLKTLRTTYRAALGKIEADRAQKAAPLYDLYLGALDAYIAELTKGNKIDEAQKVKTLRETIATQKPRTDAGPATVTTGTPTRPGTSRPGTKPAPSNGDSSDGGRGSRWYDAARWVVSVGGSLRVDKNGESFIVSSEDKIPAGRFAVLEVHITGNPKSQGIRDDDFTRFSGLKELTALNLTKIQATDAAFAFIPTTPSLTRVVISALPVTDAVLAHLAPLANLTDLHIQDTPQFTGAGLGKLASLPVLKTVWFSNSGLNDAGAKELLGGKNLEFVRLEGTPVTDEGIAGFGALTKLTHINLSRCMKVRGTTLAGWGSMPSLRELYLSGCLLSADTYPVIGKFASLATLHLDSITALNDATLPALAPLTKLTTLGLGRTSVTGSGFTALQGLTELKTLHVAEEAPISAEGLATIVATFPKLEELSLGQGAQLNAADFRSLTSLKSLKALRANLPALDDAALAEIARITSLETFYAQGTAVKLQGIVALKPLKFLTKLGVPLCKNIDDSAVPVLKDFKGLKELDIRSTAIAEAGIVELRKALPGCNVIK